MRSGRLSSCQYGKSTARASVEGTTVAMVVEVVGKEEGEVVVVSEAEVDSDVDATEEQTYTRAWRLEA